MDTKEHDDGMQELVTIRVPRRAAAYYGSDRGDLRRRRMLAKLPCDLFQHHGWDKVARIE